MQIVRVFFLKLYKKIPVIAFDTCCIPVAWYLSYLLRYNMQPFPHYINNTDSVYSLLILMSIQLSSYYYFKVYRGLWHFSSLNDLIRIIKTVSLAVFLTIPVLYLGSLLSNIPRSLFPLYILVEISLLCSGRLLMRFYRDKHKSFTISQVKKVLIIGAGRAGESLIRDLKRSPIYSVVGLVDDNASKCGLEIHGVRVLGASRDLMEIVTDCRADLIFIAIPSARSAAMRRIVNRCEQCNIPFRTLPSLSALASGYVQINSLRKVNIEDLLGRDEVQLEWEKIAKAVQDKLVIVTGGGGSIGSELCRQLVTLSPKKLLIIDNSEFNLYTIEQELKISHPDVTVETRLISVADAAAVHYHFKKFKPQIIFHAAAYKHVPLLEEQVRSATYNNIIGTQILAEASVAVNAEKFILISTDKAVNPTNIMGTTKRVAEIYCQNLNERVMTQFITVRFGNVLGSAGSVVPLFQKQLQAGGPLTVTHPDIQRYFMTIPEACQLILQAMVSGHGGEIFVLDMGEPIKISYLAEQMIHLAGKVPGKDIQIQYTGLRPGEKLYEELFHESEALTSTDHAKLFKAKFRSVDWEVLTQTFKLICSACNNHDEEELSILIKSLVPEFSMQNDISKICN